MTQPEWQRGYSLDLLRRFAGIFKEHDRGLVLGAFGAFKENNIAEALSEKMLVVDGGNRSPRAISVVERVTRARGIEDFSGARVASLVPGTVYVRRMAGQHHALHAQVERLTYGQRAVLSIWQEHPMERSIAEKLGFVWTGTKISAASELRGIYVREDAEVYGTPLIERSGLRRLAVPRGFPKLVAALTKAVTSKPLPGFADHYSSYNKAHSWTALSLRGYAPKGAPADPEFIIKPVEMSAGWKKENAEKLDWELANSPVYRALARSLNPVLDSIPGEKHRVRLMDLAPGGGELTRHSDITDPDAGVLDGKALRIHVPLVTNLDVRFRSWDLHGEQHEAHMKVGEAWYLDTRKPHTAKNGGDSQRLHLVIDVVSNHDLRGMLSKGREAEVI